MAHTQSCCVALIHIFVLQSVDIWQWQQSRLFKINCYEWKINHAIYKFSNITIQLLGLVRILFGQTESLLLQFSDGFHHEQFPEIFTIVSTNASSRGNHFSHCMVNVYKTKYMQRINHLIEHHWIFKLKNVYNGSSIHIRQNSHQEYMNL